MHTSRFGLKLAAVFLLLPLTATAGVTRTELAGNALPQFPFFEYVRTFNVNAPVKVAIDPARFPAVVGRTCNIFVVNHKNPLDWSTMPICWRHSRVGSFGSWPSTRTSPALRSR